MTPPSGTQIAPGGNYGTVAVTAGPTAEDGGRVNLWVRKPDGELVFHLNGPVTGYTNINPSTAVICGEVSVLEETVPTDKLYFKLKVRDRDAGDTFQFGRKNSEYVRCLGPMSKDIYPERPLIEGNLTVRNPE